MAKPKNGKACGISPLPHTLFFKELVLRYLTSFIRYSQDSLCIDNQNQNIQGTFCVSNIEIPSAGESST